MRSVSGSLIPLLFDGDGDIRFKCDFRAVYAAFPGEGKPRVGNGNLLDLDRANIAGKGREGEIAYRDASYNFV